MSTESNLTIGELASLSGVTAESIRYYERAGVIPKASRQGTGKYRRYGRADAERLRFVRRARELGFSLDDVRELLAIAESDPSRPCSDVNDVAHAHLLRVQEKLAQLEALEKELSRLIHGCDQDAAIGQCTLLSALSGRSSG